MADYNVHFVGWNTDDGADKIWGYFSLPSAPDVYYTFWGKRSTSKGPVLTFKRPGGMRWEFVDMGNKKERDGYQPTSLYKLDLAEQGFIEAFEQKFAMTRLCDAFHPNGRQNA
jgi:hypothetical protein